MIDKEALIEEIISILNDFRETDDITFLDIAYYDMKILKETYGR